MAPILDTGGVVVVGGTGAGLTFLAIRNDDALPMLGAFPLLLASVPLIISAAYGYVRTGKCRRLNGRPPSGPTPGPTPVGS